MAADQIGQTETDAVRYWIRAVSEAAIPFESRWTWAALKRVDPDVHARLREQCDLFHCALGTGSFADIETHGQASCRGYVKAFQVLQAAAEADDAYQLGQDPGTGLRIAIGHHKAVALRVRAVHGEGVVWVTPDEVAMLLAKIDASEMIALTKRVFPGAEILTVAHASAAGRNPITEVGLSGSHV